jgi:hypothetical protein
MGEAFWSTIFNNELPKKELMNVLRLNIVGFVRIAINARQDLEKRWNFRALLEQREFRERLLVRLVSSLNT